MRWKTQRCAASAAISGIAWIADEPVPMTATRFPLKSTGSCGQRPVWKVVPANVSRPGMSGVLVDERQPVAMMTKRAVYASPASVRTSQRSAASSKTAAATRVFNVTSRRRSKRSATWFR